MHEHGQRCCDQLKCESRSSRRSPWRRPRGGRQMLVLGVPGGEYAGETHATSGRDANECLCTWRTDD